MMALRVLTISAVVTFLCAGTGTAQTTMSLVPRATFGGYPKPFLDACLNMGQWPNVKASTTLLGSFAADLWVADDPSLSQCFSNMHAAGMQLTIEAAAFQPNGCGGGQACFDALSPLLSRLSGLAAPQIRIRLQEPFTVGRAAGWNQNDIVNETVTFLAFLHGSYAVQVTSVEAYPYNSASLLNWWMPALRNACAAAGVQSPDAFEIDHDMNASGWSWNDINAMALQAWSIGWKIGYIFGSPTPPGWTWRDTAIAQGTQLYNSLVPNFYTFESWEANQPGTTIPETSVASFTGTVLDFKNRGLYGGQ